MRKSFLIAVLLFGSTQLWAQGTAKPFISQELSHRKDPREVFAKGIATNDKSLLNLDCMKIVEITNLVAQTNLRDCTGLAGFIRQLPVEPCPQKITTGLARVLANGKIDLTGWKRTLRPDELCLFSDNRVLFSLDCGNIIPSLYTARAPVRPAETPKSVTVVPPPAPAPPVVPPPSPAPTPAPETPKQKTESAETTINNIIIINTPTEKPTPEKPPDTGGVTYELKTTPPAGKLAWNLSGMVVDSIGNLPTYRSDVVNYSHADMNLALAHLGKVEFGPYVAGDGLNARKDTLVVFPHDERAIFQAGLKFVIPIKYGWLEMGGGGGMECRGSGLGIPKQCRKSALAFLDGFFEWNRENKFWKVKSRRAIGDATFFLGNLSPFEKNNFGLVAEIEQGVTVTHLFNRIAVIPQGWLNVNTDTKGFAWNNKRAESVGMRLTIPVDAGNLNIRLGETCAQYNGATKVVPNGCGPTVELGVHFGFGGKSPGNE